MTLLSQNVFDFLDPSLNCVLNPGKGTMNWVETAHKTGCVGLFVDAVGELVPKIQAMGRLLKPST